MELQKLKLKEMNNKNSNQYSAEFIIPSVGAIKTALQISLNGRGASCAIMKQKIQD